MSNQEFDILDVKYSDVPMVDVMTWFGDSTKTGISVCVESLPDLRDAIDDYLEKLLEEEEQLGD